MSEAAFFSANTGPLAARLLLAQDPATPPVHLQDLGLGPNSRAIKQAVAANPNTPPALLLALAGRYWQAFLENPVLPLLLLEDPGLPHRLPLRVLRALVRREGVPPLILQTLARHPDREVREGARFHVDAEASPAVDAGWQANIRTALAQLPAPAGTLAELLSTGCVPDWLLDTVASTNNTLVQKAFFEASHRPTASPALRQAAGMLRRAAGEPQSRQYHHDYGYGASVERWRVGQGLLTEAELTRLAKGNPTWQLLAAKAPNLPAALVERLARSAAPKVVAAIARRRGLPPAVALGLASRGLLLATHGLAQNPSTPEHVLARLARATDTTTRERVARNRSTPPATLAALATDAQDLVRYAVAGNRRTPPEALEKLATDADPDIRKRVGHNPACTLAIYTQHLVHDADPKVRTDIARRAGLPQPVLRQFLDDAEKDVRHAAAYNSNTPRHILDFINLHHHDTPAERPPLPEWGTGKGWRMGPGGRRETTSEQEQTCISRMYGHQNPAPTPEEVTAWASSPNLSLRRTVAYMTTSPEVLEQLRADADAEIRRYAAGNKCVTIALLVQLAADTDETVRAAVAGQALLAEHHPELLRQLVAEENPKINRQAAGNAQADPALLGQLALDADEKVRKYVAGNSRTPPHTLALLNDDPSPAVRKALLRNDNLPVPVLLARLAGGSTEVRHTLAGNEATPPETLWQLAQEENDDIRSAIAYNKAAPARVVEYLWETQGPDRKRNSALAHHPNASEELMRRIAADTEPHAMSYLLDHPAITEELFRQLLALMTAPKAKQYLAYSHSKQRPAWFYAALLDDGDPDVLNALARQRDTPEPVLVELARRAPLSEKTFDHLTHSLVNNNTAPQAVLEVLVASRAEEDATEGSPWWYATLAAHPRVTPVLLATVLEAALVYQRRYPYRSLSTRRFDTWLALVSNPLLPTELLAHFAEHPAREVRYALLQRPDCPPELRQQMRAAALRRNLEKGSSVLGRAAAAADAATSAEWLVWLHPKAGWVERLAMVENPNLPAELLETLAQDAHRLVRAAAQQRQATGQVPDLLGGDAE